MNTRYDVESIAMKRKKEMFCSVFWCIFGVLLLALSIITIIFRGTDILLFVISTLCIIFSLYILFYEKKNAKFARAKTYHGTVEKVDIKVGASNGIMTVGYGGLVRKRYSKYFRDINRVILYIKSNETIKLLELKDVSKNLESYYKIGTEVIHVGGTQFPVKPEFSEQWLCPICGEFNSEDVCNCRSCKNLILKKTKGEPI